MTCDHEWETWARSDPFDYGYRCRRCGMRAEDYVRSMRHRCPDCGAEIGYIPVQTYIIHGPGMTWGRCHACGWSIRLDLCPCKDPQTALEDYA